MDLYVFHVCFPYYVIITSIYYDYVFLHVVGLMFVISVTYPCDSFT